ncbi:hypothetical protein SUDANB106_02466 [Streptomyces sp. enrichment culture]|uniref:hypothetical protein n=1 Tax=Streptomyces sp. enrichment culture TaxID=1795815 RepID=UPI003F57965F
MKDVKKKGPGATRVARLSIALSLIILVLVVGVVYGVWGRGGSGEDLALCNGVLKEGALSPLSVNPNGEYESSYSGPGGGPEGGPADRRGLISRCSVWQPEGEVAEFEVFDAWGFGPFRSEPVTPGWYVNASPFGSGSNGWTENRRAEVWLPQECAEAFKAGNGPVQVQLELRNTRHEQWEQGDTRRRMAEVLMSYAKGLAEAEGCDADGFGLTEEASGAPSYERVPDEGQCGLSGFGATRDQADRTEILQSTVGDPKDSWICVLARDGDSSRKYALVAFAVTKDEQLISHHRESQVEDPEEFRTDIVTCGDREYLVQMSHAGTDPRDHDEHERKAFEYAEASLLSPDLLYKGFVDGIKPRLGCSS